MKRRSKRILCNCKNIEERVFNLSIIAFLFSRATKMPEHQQQQQQQQQNQLSSVGSFPTIYEHVPAQKSSIREHVRNSSKRPKDNDEELNNMKVEKVGKRYHQKYPTRETWFASSSGLERQQGFDDYDVDMGSCWDDEVLLPQRPEQPNPNATYQEKKKRLAESWDRLIPALADAYVRAVGYQVPRADEQQPISLDNGLACACEAVTEKSISCFFITGKAFSQMSVKIRITRFGNFTTS